MALVVLLLRVVQALVTVRIAAVRTTLRLTVFISFFAYGFLVGPVVTPALGRFLSPYGWGGGVAGWTAVWARLFPSMGVLFILMLPVLALHGSVRVRAGLSIADSFLLAWACGYGFDLQRLFFAAVYSTAPLKDFTILPPGLIENATTTAVSCAYLVALPVLLYAAGLRMFRVRQISWVLLAAGILISGVIYGEGMLGADTPIPAKALVQGETPYWIIFLGFMVLEFFEGRQAAAGSQLSALAEWRAAIVALTSGKWQAWREAARRFRLTVRIQLVELELRKNPANAQLANQSRQLRDALSQATSSPGSSPRMLLNRYWTHAGLVLLLFIVILPLWPAARTVFWNVPVLHFNLTDTALTVFSLGLAGFIVRLYVTSAGAPWNSWDTEEAVRFAGERAVLRAALGIVILLVVYGHAGDYYQMASPVSAMVSAPLETMQVQELIYLILVITAIATGVTLSASARWRQAPLALRQRVAIDRVLEVAVLAFGAWIVFPLFPPLQVYLHANHGPWLFNSFGGNGNSLGDFLLGLLMIPIAYGLFFLLRRTAKKIRAFFAGAEPGAGGKLPARAAAARAGGD
jgi:hypothetical protein